MLFTETVNPNDFMLSPLSACSRLQHRWHVTAGSCRCGTLEVSGGGFWQQGWVSRGASTSPPQAGKPRSATSVQTELLSGDPGLRPAEMDGTRTGLLSSGHPSAGMAAPFNTRGGWSGGLLATCRCRRRAVQAGCALRAPLRPRALILARGPQPPEHGADERHDTSCGKWQRPGERPPCHEAKAGALLPLPEPTFRIAARPEAQGRDLHPTASIRAQVRMEHLSIQLPQACWKGRTPTLPLCEPKHSCLHKRAFAHARRAPGAAAAASARHGGSHPPRTSRSRSSWGAWK